MKKSKNTVEVSLVVIVSVILWMCIYYSLTSYKTELSGGYTIRRVGMAQRLALYNQKNEKLLTGISEWMETDRYVYGYGDGSKFNYYIYDKELNNSLLFNDGFDKDGDWYDKLHELNLHYNMTDCRSDVEAFPPIFMWIRYFFE